MLLFSQHVVFHCIIIQSVLCQERSDEEKLDLILNDRDAQWNPEGLDGRTTRRKLPSKNLFDGRLDSINCGGTYVITHHGYYLFDLSPPSQTCEYNFLGSRNEKCTTAILCKDTITLAPASKAGCDKEWLILLDGTKGQMSGCGRFSFSGVPRIPRNNGTDIYLFLKGSSKTRCIAFCVEESSDARIKPARKISKNKKFQGFQMETDCKCGIRTGREITGRVVGGENAEKNEFRWIGAVVFKGRGYERKPFCGGSLVSDRYFISAAHCFAIDNVKPHEIQVVLNAHLMDKRVRGNPEDPKYGKIPGWNLPPATDESEESVRMEVQEITTHPLFDDRSFDYDIAILKFTRAVNLKKGKTVPICLPYMGESFEFEDGASMVVAGWGRPWEDAPAGSRLLQKLEMPYLNLKKCKKYSHPTQRHMCAGYVEGGKDACSGDSGGPLIHELDHDESQYLLVGTVSAGAGCARPNTVGLYSDVQELLQWAYHHMPEALYCPR